MLSGYCDTSCLLFKVIIQSIFVFFFFQECVKDMDLRNLLSISMDGPNVNWKFLEMMQDQQKDQFSKQMLVVGSCGLHTMHNAFKGICSF